MRQPRLRRLWPWAVPLLVILVLIVACLRSPGTLRPFRSYETQDDHTLTVITWGHPHEWCRPISVVETQSEVRI